MSTPIHKARHTYGNLRPYKPWAYTIAKFRLQDYLPMLAVGLAGLRLKVLLKWRITLDYCPMRKLVK